MMSLAILIVRSNLIRDCMKSTDERQSKSIIASLASLIRLRNWPHFMNADFCTSSLDSSLGIFAFFASANFCFSRISFFSSYLTNKLFVFIEKKILCKFVQMRLFLTVFQDFLLYYTAYAYETKLPP